MLSTWFATVSLNYRILEQFTKFHASIKLRMEFGIS